MDADQVEILSYPACERVENIDEGLKFPPGCIESTTVKGTYGYWHYGCDGQDDRGWGCGYRTLQTLCDWSRRQLQKKGGTDCKEVPTLQEIQSYLVEMEDKPPSLIGSRDWIGSVEVGLVVDFLYDIPCKILHVDSGSKLHQHMDELMKHFTQKGSPIMMGGDSDNASKGIIGVCRCPDEYYLLVLDPHYYGPKPDQNTLVQEHMLLWKPLSDFKQDSFYNLCLPQLRLT